MAKPKTIRMQLNLFPPSAGNMASFVLTQPDRSVLRQSIMTAANGNTVADFNLGPKYKSGTYLGEVNVTVNGLPMTVNSLVVL